MRRMLIGGALLVLAGCSVAAPVPEPSVSQAPAPRSTAPRPTTPQPAAPQPAASQPAASQPGASQSPAAEPAASSPTSVGTPSPGPGEPATTSTTVPSRSALAEAVREAGSALYEPPPAPLPAPTSLTVDSLGIDDAPIMPVGVRPDGDMEIPGAAEVGWYRFGSRPGDSGSAVLAAHIAFNGADGVFRRLDRLEPGDRFTVGFEGGEQRRFEVTETSRYDKEELPTARIFARDSGPRIALITCGGDFNRALREYEDNVVVYGVPIEDATDS